MTQVAGQASPSTVFPSSHVSPGSRNPFPQPGATGGSWLMAAWMQSVSTIVAALPSVPAHATEPSALVKAVMRPVSAFARQATNVGSGFEPPVARPFDVAFDQHFAFAAPSLPAALSFALGQLPVPVRSAFS